MLRATIDSMAEDTTADLMARPDPSASAAVPRDTGLFMVLVRSVSDPIALRGALTEGAVAL